MADTSSKSKLELAKDAYLEGASDVEVATVLGVTIARFYQMYEELPDFARFVDQGRTLSQAWWYEKARKNLWNKEFNTALWNFNMKNRYGWADKVDHADKTDSTPVDINSVKGELAAALKRLATKNPELLSGMNLNVPTDADE